MSPLSLNVIKIGGSTINDWDKNLAQINQILDMSQSIIIVHGGGKNIKLKLDKFNLESKFINGLRVTDEKTIKLVEEALLELNFEIFNSINNHQAKAISVTPKQNNVIKVKKESLNVS